MYRVSFKNIIHYSIFVFILVYLTTSCNKGGYDANYYNVLNNTNSNIKVIFKKSQYYSYSNSDITNDSTVSIIPGQKTTILVEVFDPDNTNINTSISITGLASIKIYKNDSVFSLNNYLLKKYWNKSSAKNKQSSELKLTISDSDFPN
jgi:hypothetical protein